MVFCRFSPVGSPAHPFQPPESNPNGATSAHSRCAMSIEYVLFIFNHKRRKERRANRFVGDWRMGPIKSQKRCAIVDPSKSEHPWIPAPCCRHEMQPIESTDRPLSTSSCRRGKVVCRRVKLIHNSLLRYIVYKIKDCPWLKSFEMSAAFFHLRDGEGAEDMGSPHRENI